MDECCNYKTQKRFGFISKRIRQVHQTAISLTALCSSLCCTQPRLCLPGVTCPCRWVSKGSTGGCPACTVPAVCQHCTSGTAQMWAAMQILCSQAGGWRGCREVWAEETKASEGVVRGQWWMGSALSKGGWAGKFSRRWKILKMGWMRENSAWKDLVKISVWHRGWWPPQSICKASGGFLTGGAGCKQGFIWEFCVKMYISASNRRSDCNEFNECGTRDVSGRRQNVGFLVCIISTLGSWVSFNCHPKLLILPENEECEESYWFPSGQTIYFLVLISLMCIFIACHCCDQAKAAFIGRFQAGFQLNMWLELQGVNGKNWLATLAVLNMLLVMKISTYLGPYIKHLFAVMSSCTLKIKWAQKGPSSLPAQQEKVNVDFIWCIFVYKCGVTEQKIRSKKCILHFALKTQMSIVNMIAFGGGFQISWAKCHIFFPVLDSFLVSETTLFQYSWCRSWSWKKDTRRKLLCSLLFSNATRKKINGVTWKKRLRGETGDRINFAKQSKTHTGWSLQYTNSIMRHQHFYTATQSNFVHVMEIGVPMQGRCVHSFSWFTRREHLSYEDSLRLFSQHKRQPQGHLTVAFQYLKGAYKRETEKLLHRQDRGQEGIV